MNICHIDDRLEEYMRRKTPVKITFFNDETKTGVIYRDREDHFSGRYAIDHVHFYKSHVKKIELL